MAKKVSPKDDILKEWPSGFLLLKSDFKPITDQRNPSVTFGVHIASKGATALIHIFDDIEKTGFGNC
jgi:hypothetical protein